MVKEVAFHTLKTLLPKGQVFTDRASLVTYEVDAGGDKGMPEGVVFPRTPDEVARVVRWAAEHNVPLVARGAGTGLSGGAVADRGGIIVEFSQMNQVLDVDVDGRSAVVEPALINLRLDERVKTYGLYFPPDPASQRASPSGATWPKTQAVRTASNMASPPTTSPARRSSWPMGGAHAWAVMRGTLPSMICAG